MMTVQRDTERPEGDVKTWDQLPLWKDPDWRRLLGNLPECWDCSAAFTPESSPSDEYCWMCAERRAEEGR